MKVLLSTIINFRGHRTINKTVGDVGEVGGLELLLRSHFHCSWLDEVCFVLFLLLLLFLYSFLSLFFGFVVVSTFVFIFVVVFLLFLLFLLRPRIYIRGFVSLSVRRLVRHVELKTIANVRKVDFIILGNDIGLMQC